MTTVWKEDKFTVPPAVGIEEREKRVVVWITKELPKTKTGVSWGCVQTHGLWSTEEEVHTRPGNH